MTRNKRAKRDARERQQITDEPYVTARRRTARRDRYFEDDCCANCLERLPEEEERLYCSEPCSYTAETVRYWRRILRDHRIEQVDVKLALDTRIAHILAGGYHKETRRLTNEVQHQVRERDAGLCVMCGNPGEEIDHIRDDSSDLHNLQLLCKTCHHAKTAERMSPASVSQQQAIEAVYRTRVLPDIPAQLSDDELRWENEHRALKAARRQRLMDQLERMGIDPVDYRGATRAEILADIDDAMFDDTGGWTEDDDSGYGPYSYFTHAMTKDN